MYVQQFMKPQVITVSPDENILNAVNIMKTKRINRLPVVEKGKLVGIVTDGDLREASPSAATSLSKYEVNELLSKATVKDVSTKKVITCSPETLIEDAALDMREYKIGALPVLESGQIVGIISQNDIMDAFLDIMGVRSPGRRIVVEVRDELGIMNEVSSVIKEFQLDITNLALYHLPNRMVQIFCRVVGEQTDEAVNALLEKGYKVVQ
ncbi:acetoin utilization protein [Desulfuribacillus stibiiarsenatis]|uniref:Acetoin utilization protein n=1 Tax=Desulfuribacillus stibiiarsenatis TaxID=1390249 RepID=A0A1E5L4N6_9FIRM|nr:CBS domain-containing protein [Desulfuribacillus stibiiarsenatis]OEH85024.1 acetoin utilization protein [Desulfuribacillus stibiiarsenatis]